MAHISENWPDVVEPAFYKIFDGEYTRFTEKKSMLSILFGQRTSKRSYEKDSSAGALGDWETFSGTIGYQDTAPGYDRRYEFDERVKGIKIERKLYDKTGHCRSKIWLYRGNSLMDNPEQRLKDN